MAIVDSAPTLAYAAQGDNGRKTDALLYPDDATVVYFCGGPTVAASGPTKGMPFTQDNPLSVSGIHGDDFYVIADTGDSNDLIVLENGY